MGESSKPGMLTIKILLAESGAIIRLDMALDSRRAFRVSHRTAVRSSEWQFVCRTSDLYEAITRRTGVPAEIFILRGANGEVSQISRTKELSIAILVAPGTLCGRHEWHSMGVALQGANPELFVFSRQMWQKGAALPTGGEKFVKEALKLSQREPFKKPQQARGRDASCRPHRVVTLL